MKPTVCCQVCGKLIELTNFNWDKHRVCGKECYREWEWRYSLAIMEEDYRMDMREKQLPGSAAEIMREAGVPNMLEGRTLGLRIK